MGEDSPQSMVQSGGQFRGDCDKRKTVINTERRRELLGLAIQQQKWMVSQGILPHERHLFRHMTDLLYSD